MAGMTNNRVATDAPDEAALLNARTVEPGIVTCDACPVLCPERVLPARVPLGPRPWLRPLLRR